MTAIEDARAALARLDDPKHGSDWSGWDYAADLETAIRPLIAEHERLTTPPADDEMEPLTGVIRDSIDRWGDLFPTPEVARYVADDVEAAGFRRQGPITDAQVEAAAKALAETFGEEPHLPWDRWGELSRDEFRQDARTALEAARDA